MSTNPRFGGVSTNLRNLLTDCDTKLSNSSPSKYPTRWRHIRASLYSNDLHESPPLLYPTRWRI